MNLRRKRPPDSLYMLLDTMCNAFGGIILLAVLVTLLTSNERQIRAAASTDSSGNASTPVGSCRDRPTAILAAISLAPIQGQ